MGSTPSFVNWSQKREHRKEKAPTQRWFKDFIKEASCESEEPDFSSEMCEQMKKKVKMF